MKTSETIAAVCTAEGEGGVGIIRISGPGARAAAARVFKPAGQGLRERYLSYGRFHRPGSVETLDDGYAVFIPGPGSYTGEDVVELFCHGGALVTRRVLEAVLEAGPRPAGPGEFTRRAFLSGRLDLAQAEAVLDVIRARTDSALRSARAHLDGALTRRVEEVKGRVVDLVVRMEAELDFPEEEDIGGLADPEVLDGLTAAEAGARSLLETFREGSALKEGVKTVIIGTPNVGKSSLLNRLLKEERAIVTELPGTTRDVIEEAINIKGVAVRLMDTAGLRKTTDFVEAIGVEAARKRLAEARLVLFVVDSSAAEYEPDLGLLEAVEDKELIVVANKVDSAGPDGLERVRRSFAPYSVAFVSALTGEGLDALEELIYEKAVGHPYGAGDVPEGMLLTSARHKDLLERAMEGLSRARESVGDKAPREVVSGELRWALSRLGEITGEVTTEDILEKIFGEFCIGK